MLCNNWIYIYLEWPNIMIIKSEISYIFFFFLTLFTVVFDMNNRFNI